MSFHLYLLFKINSGTLSEQTRTTIELLFINRFSIMNKMKNI